MSDFSSCPVSISQDDFRYYVKDIGYLDSDAAPLSSDSRYNHLPEELRLWDSIAKYWKEFSNLDIQAKNPNIFIPNPWTGDYQNLWTIEDNVPIGRPWDNSVYDASINLEFPDGFLQPSPPTVDYVFDPYQPIIDLDIPPFDIPDIAVPYLVLPDFNITKILRRGIRRVQINFAGVCMTSTETFTSHSKLQIIDVSWDAPSSGKYVLMVNNGNCYWQTVGEC